MSKRDNWKHYHIERYNHSNDNTPATQAGRVFERIQRYRKAWELISNLARVDNTSSWRVVECQLPSCHQYKQHPGSSL